MSRLNVENIRHPDAASDSLQLSNTGNITAPGNLSVTGTSTLTDDLIVDTDTLFVDVSTDLVGIGTTSPDNRLHVFAGDSSGSSSTQTQFTIENSGNSGLQFLAGTSSVSEIRFGDSGDNGAGSIAYFHSDNSIRFGTNNGTERLRIASDGTVQLRNSTGIDFSQIQTNATGMTSETLDGYEEGTFTPDVFNDGSTSRWNDRRGFYRKIGSQVTVWIDCDGGTQPRSGTSTGTIEISGLPFSINSDLNHNHILGIIGYNRNTGGSADANVSFAGNVLRVRIGGTDQTDLIDYASTCFTYYV